MLSDFELDFTKLGLEKWLETFYFPVEFWEWNGKLVFANVWQKQNLIRQIGSNQS